MHVDEDNWKNDDSSFYTSNLDMFYLQIIKAATYGYCLKKTFREFNEGNDPMIPPALRANALQLVLDIFLWGLNDGFGRTNKGGRLEDL